MIALRVTVFAECYRGPCPNQDYIHAICYGNWLRTCKYTLDRLEDKSTGLHKRVRGPKTGIFGPRLSTEVECRARPESLSDFRRAWEMVFLYN